VRLAAIVSSLAIVLCVAVFGAILLQKASLQVPGPAPPQATPTEGRSPGSVVTVADSATERAVAAATAVAQYDVFLELNGLCVFERSNEGHGKASISVPRLHRTTLAAS
jgi:hypothetical protein